MKKKHQLLFTAILFILIGLSMIASPGPLNTTQQTLRGNGGVASEKI